MLTYPEHIATGRYIDTVWHKTTTNHYWVPADGCWDIIFVNRPGEDMRVFIVGPMTKAKFARHAPGTELFGIRFKPGVYMPQLLPSAIIDQMLSIHSDPGRSIVHLEGAQYKIPTPETAECFVGRLREHKVLARNPFIDRILEQQAMGVSLRGTQRHFAKTVGLTKKFIEQTKRAHAAAELIRTQANAPLCSIATQAGYADQAHMTRSLKLILGLTPGQLTYAIDR